MLVHCRIDRDLLLPAIRSQVEFNFTRFVYWFIIILFIKLLSVRSLIGLLKGLIGLQTHPLYFYNVCYISRYKYKSIHTNLMMSQKNL